MATISTIGLRITVLTEDVTRGVNKALQSLDRLKAASNRGIGSLLNPFSGIFDRLSDVFTRLASSLASAWGMIRAGLSDIKEGVVQATPFFVGLAQAAYQVFRGLYTISWISTYVRIGLIRVGLAVAWFAAKGAVSFLTLAAQSRIVADAFAELGRNFVGTFNAIRQIAGQIGQQFKTIFTDLVGWLQGSPLQAALIRMFSAAAAGVRLALRGITAVASEFGRQLGANFAGVFGVFRQLGASVLDVFRPVVVALTAAFSGGTLGRRILAALSTVWAAVTQSVAAAVAQMGPVFKQGLAALSNLGSAFGSFGVALWGAVKPQLQWTLTSIAGLWSQGWARIVKGGSILKGMFTGIGLSLTLFDLSGLLKVFAGVGKVLGGIFQAVFAVVKAVAEAAAEIFVALAKAAGAAAAALLGVGVALVKIALHGIESITHLRNLSAAFGVTYNSMVVLLEAANRAGVQGNTLEHWLRHLEALLGGVTQGSYDALRTFKLLGVDGAALAKLPLDQAFMSVVEQLRSLPSQYDRARGAALLFGRDFEKALALINNPKLNTADLERQLRRAGVLLGSGDLAAVGKAQEAIFNIKATLSGLTNQIAVQLAPIMEVVVNGFLAWLDSVGGVRGAVGRLRDVTLSTLDFIVEGVARMIETWLALVPVFALLARAGLEFARLMLKYAILPILVGLAQIGGDIGKSAESGVAGVGDALAAIPDLQQGIIDGQKAVRSSMAGMSDQLRGGWAAMRKEIDKTVLASMKAAEIQDKAAVKAGKRPVNVGFLKDLMDKQGEVEMPELDRFMRAVKQVQQLQGAKFLTPDEGAKSILKQLEEAEQRLGVHGVKNPAPLEINSSQAGSVIANAFNSTDRMNPQERVARLLEEARTRDEIRLKYAKEIRDALVKVKGVKIP